MLIVDYECFFFLFIEEEKFVMVFKWFLLKVKVRYLRYVFLVDIFFLVIVENR